ncbi:mediator of RNA polymerase II transcription subunit 9 [Mytilus galloprovincialis]|uniref:Mediator of RNA polymerase II transcription subunit 9 n=1 Tax=Mytilus galloprovincialis TaxID=29158 RepID=A0A8B6H680_MYTGA|nr:mediator of RNA polymerase II transcription subunit 9 [Mytilus galloprovincialis]
MGDTGEQELNFLPLISDLLKSVEKESGDVNTKMTELKTKLDKAREFVEKMPGIQQSQSEQIKQIDILRNQLTVKTALLEKYKSMDKFDLSS